MNRSKRVFQLAAGYLCSAVAWSAFAADIEVPGDFPTIQQAIDNSASGDRIIVDYGVYNESLTIPHSLHFESPGLNQTDVILTGTGLGAPIATILDYVGVVVFFEGFTFTDADPGFAAISAEHGINVQNCAFTSNPDRAIDTTHPVTAIDCMFLLNEGSRGAAIYINTSPTHIVYIENCEFSANTSTLSGGAVVINGTDLATITGCFFNGNETTSGTSVGGGALRISQATVDVSNCLFVNNTAGSTGGAISVGGDPGSVVTLINNTIADNDAPASGGDGLYVASGSTVLCYNTILRQNIGGDDIVNDGTFVSEYSCVPPQFPGEGNVHPTGPIFDCDVDLWTLLVRSPCIDAGRNSDAIDAGLIDDLNGNNRLIDVPAVPDTGVGTAPIVDMGCYEHVPQGSARRYVDADAASGGNGMSWATAYNDLQDAIDEARCGNVRRIWVAEGIYKPDRGTGNRNDSFDMLTGLTIYGGFDGTETDLSQRDWLQHESKLSGAIGTSNDPTDNSYHVVTANDVYDGVLNGLYIQRGYNETGGGGAGIIVDAPSDTPRFIYCTIRWNTAVGASRGAGAYLGNTGAWFINSRFIENVGEDKGGGAYVYNALDDGPQFWGCIFNGNIADEGGGLYVDDLGEADVINSTFHYNIATVGNAGGAYVDSVSGPELDVANSVFWGNTGASGTTNEQQLSGGGTLTVNYSNIEGWDGSLGGVGNIGEDPLFVDADGADDIPGNGDDLLALTCLSPCVDTGDDASVPADLDKDGHGEARILHGRVDMGFDEYAGPYAEVASLTGLQMVNGTLISGGLPDLLTSDDQYVQTKSGFGSSLIDLHHMEIAVQAETNVASPASLIVTVEQRVSHPTAIADLYLYNWSTGLWDRKRTVVINDVDQSGTSTPIDISSGDYIDGIGRMRVSVRHTVHVPYLAFLFDSYLDQVEIIVVPVK